jgi:hypothetical protein
VRHCGPRALVTFNEAHAQDVWLKASVHLVNRFDKDRLPVKYPLEEDKLGRVDRHGNFLIQLPEHHVHVDERNFFSRYMYGERLRVERESRLEAFGKSLLSHFLIKL